MFLLLRLMFLCLLLTVIIFPTATAFLPIIFSLLSTVTLWCYLYLHIKYHVPKLSNCVFKPTIIRLVQTYHLPPSMGKHITCARPQSYSSSSHTQPQPSSTENYFHRTDFWNLSWISTTVFGFGIEAEFHGTSCSSGIAWCPWILSIFTLCSVIYLLSPVTVLFLLPAEYLPLFRAEILIRAGVVAGTGW